MPQLKPSEDERYTYADYLTWDDDKLRRPVKPAT